MSVKINLPNIESGAMYVHSYLWYTEDETGVQTPVDLTAHSAALQAKADGATTPAISWSTVTGEITLTGNRIDIEVTADDTDGLVFDSIPYDLLIWPTANPERAVRVAYGEVTAAPVVTVIPV